VVPPAGYVQDWAGLTSATDNRTLFFTVKAKGGSASSPQFVARTRVDEEGRPGKAVLVARVPRSRDLPAASPAPQSTQAPSAWPSITALAPSPDATRLALALSGHGGDVLVVRDLRTGKERAWSSRFGIDAISWSEDGRQVHWSADGTAGDLSPQSRQGMLPAGRKVPAAGDPLGAVLLPGGDRLALRQTTQDVRLVLLPSGGGAVRVLDEWKDVPGFLELPAADATGRHVFYRRGDGWARIDLKTGKRTAFSLPADSTQPGVFYTW
jgi:hypothetical protein